MLPCLILIGILAVLGCCLRTSAGSPRVQCVSNTDTYTINGGKRSIASWHVLLPESATADDIVAMFRRGGYGGGRQGFVIWRNARGVTAHYHIRNEPFGWDETTALDISDGQPADSGTLDRLFGLAKDLDRLPKEDMPTIDDHEYFIFIKQGPEVRKYRTQSSVMSAADPTDATWLRFYHATENLW